MLQRFDMGMGMDMDSGKHKTLIINALLQCVN